MTLWCLSGVLHFCVIFKLTECVLCPIIQITAFCHTAIEERWEGGEQLLWPEPVCNTSIAGTDSYSEGTWACGLHSEVSHPCTRSVPKPSAFRNHRLGLWGVFFFSQEDLVGSNHACIPQAHLFWNKKAAYCLHWCLWLHCAASVVLAFQCLYVLADRMQHKGQIDTGLSKLVCKICSLALAVVNLPLPLFCFQESRDGRVDSWRNFQANTKGKKEKKNRTFLRPPKVKMEQREWSWQHCQRAAPHSPPCF